MGEGDCKGCQVCHSSRKPLLCPNCIKRGLLNDLALKSIRHHRQKLLERVNRSLDSQVCTYDAQVMLRLFLSLSTPKLASSLLSLYYFHLLPTSAIPRALVSFIGSGQLEGMVTGVWLTCCSFCILLVHMLVVCPAEEKGGAR